MATFAEVMKKWSSDRRMLVNVVIIGTMFTAGVAYMLYVLATDVATGPCDPEGYPGRCYEIQKLACNTVWNQSEARCKTIISGLNLPPTRLVGPILFKCQALQLDQTFEYNRHSTPECTQLRDELREWKMRNPDFQ